MKQTAEQKIVIISPYSSLKIIVDRVLQDQALQLRLDSIEGDMHHGAALAQEAEQQGKEIIISRGGTARLIAEGVTLPVVEIKVTGYDILRTLIRYKDQPCSLGIIGYDNVINGCQTVCELLDIEMMYFPINDESESLAALEQALRSGVSCIIGDTVGVAAAKRVDVQFALIESGREAISNAIDEALQLHEAIVQERNAKQRLQAILDFSHEGIMAVDRHGKVTLYNHAAEKMFKIPANQVIGHDVQAVIPNTRLPHILQSGQAEIGKLQKTGHAMLATNRVPIHIKREIIGAVATFQDVTKIQELEQKIRQRLHRRGLIAQHRFEDILGISAAIRQAISLAQKFARIESTTLLYGESGTGKELFAQSVHNASQRRHGPFVAVNCAALPGSLLESELFGYVQGAFTGARHEGKKGLFELAHNGTIFLDEVAEMDLQVQARILRVLQEKEVMRIGDDKVIPVNVRIIAATNKRLQHEVQQARFRQDLFYRLNILTLDLPPLRQRPEDIEPLVTYFMGEFCRHYHLSPPTIPEDVLTALQQYSWPGNVRELQNVVQKLLIISDGKATLQHIEQIFSSALTVYPAETTSEDGLFEGSLKEITHRIIVRILEEEDYNKSRAARRLQIDRGTLDRKLRKRTGGLQQDG